MMRWSHPAHGLSSLQYTLFRNYRGTALPSPINPPAAQQYRVSALPRGGFYGSGPAVLSPYHLTWNLEELYFKKK